MSLINKNYINLEIGRCRSCPHCCSNVILVLLSITKFICIPVREGPLKLSTEYLPVKILNDHDGTRPVCIVDVDDVTLISLACIPSGVIKRIIEQQEKRLALYKSLIGEDDNSGADIINKFKELLGS